MFDNFLDYVKKNIHRLILGSLIFVTMLYFPISRPYAVDHPTQVLIVNQVRGMECCGFGSLKNVKMQVEALVENKIPAVFVLRYDALSDPEYIKYFTKIKKIHPKLISFGILFEITPQLADDASVRYKSTKERWFESQGLYTIGYSTKEDKKLSDTIFTKFYSVFGYYPELVSSWIIDTDTVNYIHSKYDVKVIQITREQWGIDGLTLYGAPPHNPYPASPNWVMIPNYSSQNAPVIVRQTVEDPVRNYGDNTSSHTSQPNDYANANKKIDYFIDLVKQASIDQLDQGFILLGLENTMEEAFQKEFQSQIAFIGKSKDEYRFIFPKVKDIAHYWSTTKMQLYWGKDLDGEKTNQAYWITSPKYRVRLLINNSKVMITDIRLFDIQYQDPYNSYPAKKEGYWIVPYIIDGSLWSTKVENKRLVTPAFHSKNLLAKSNQHNDLDTQPTNISFPNMKKNSSIRLSKSGDMIYISYESINNLEVKFIFGLESINIEGISVADMSYQDHTQELFPVKYIQKSDGWKLEWILNGKVAHYMNMSCEEKSCNATFYTNPESLSEIRNFQYQFMFPESVGREINEENSVVYFHNRYAIAGRNPNRLVLMTYDKNNLPTIFKDITITTSDRDVQITSGFENELQFYDFYSDKPLVSHINIVLNNKVKKDIDIYFAPNCKLNIRHCLVRPQYLWWYIKTIINDKLRLYKDREVQ